MLQTIDYQQKIFSEILVSIFNHAPKIPPLQAIRSYGLLTYMPEYDSKAQSVVVFVAEFVGQ